MNPAFVFADTGASLRSFGGVARNYDAPALFGAGNRYDGFARTLLRVASEGEPSGALRWQAHGVLSLDLAESAPQGGLLPEGAGSGLRYRVVDETDPWLSRDREQGALWLDRCNLRWSPAWGDLTVGRQAIGFGKAYFWNPLDVFLPFDPRQFDRDYKPGVDALRLDLPAGAFSGFNLVAAAGRELDTAGGYADHGRWGATWYGSALLGRGYATLGGWDLSVQGGKVYGGWQAGGAATGELGPLALRLEAAQFLALPQARRRTVSGSPGPAGGPALQEDHLAAVLGLGRHLDNGLHLEAEYLYNGAGDPGDLDLALARYARGASLQLNRHVLGLAADHEILPILRGNLAALCALGDGSVLVQPGLALSTGNESELLAGAAMALGPRPRGASLSAPGLRSEFGAWPDFWYLEFKVYF